MNLASKLNEFIESSNKESIKETGEILNEYYTTSEPIEKLRNKLNMIKLEEEIIKWLVENDMPLALEIIENPIQLIKEKIEKKYIAKVLSFNPMYRCVEKGANGKILSKIKGELKDVVFDSTLSPVFENKYYSISILLQAFKRRFLLKQLFPVEFTCFEMREICEYESLQNNRIYKELFSSVKNQLFDENLMKKVNNALISSYELARFRAFDGFITVIELMKQHQDKIGMFCSIFEKCFLDYHFLIQFIDNNGIEQLKNGIEKDEVQRIIYILNLLPSTAKCADESGINDLIINYTLKNQNEWGLNCCKEIALNGKRRDELKEFGLQLIKEKKEIGVDIIKNWFWREDTIKEFQNIQIFNIRDGIAFIQSLITKEEGERDVTFIQRYHAIMSCILSDDIKPPSQNELTLFFLHNYPISVLLQSNYYSYVNDFVRFLLSLINSSFKKKVVSLLASFIQTQYESLLPIHLYNDIIDLLESGHIASAVIIKSFKEKKLIEGVDKQKIESAIVSGLKNHLSVEFIRCFDGKQPLPLLETTQFSNEIIEAILEHSEKYGKWELSEMYLKQCIIEFKNGKRDSTLIHILTVARKVGMKVDIVNELLMSIEINEENAIDYINFFENTSIFDKSSKEAEDLFASKYFEQKKFDCFEDLQIPMVAIVPIGTSSDEFFFPIAEKMEALGIEFSLNLGNAPFRFIKLSKQMFNNKNINFLRFFSIVAVLDCENLKDFEIKKHINALQSSVDANWEHVYSIQFLLVNYPSSLPNINSFMRMEDNKIHVINNCPVVKNIINSVMLQLGEMKTFYPALAPDKYIIPKKNTTISFLLNAAEVHLYLSHYDVSFKFFRDALKLAKTLNDSINIMLSCVGMCSCLISENKPFEEIINEAIEVLNRKGEKKCCKRIKLLQTQYFINNQNYEMAKKTIEEINRFYDGNEIGGEVFDCYLALQQASILNQLGMVQHQRYILQRVCCVSKESSFSNFAVNELAKLLNVYFIDDIDKEEQINSLHEKTITKVQWESIQAYVLYRSIAIRNKYDDKCAQIILRLLTKYVKYIKNEDQNILLNRLKIIAKTNGEIPVVPSSAQPLPLILSSFIVPSLPVLQTKTDTPDSPWIVDPTADKKAASKVYLVANEDSELKVTFKNKLSVEIEISNLYPSSTGVKLKTIPISIKLPPLSTIIASLKIVPQTPGHLTIDKLNYCCCSLLFNTPINVSINVIPPLPLLKPIIVPPSVTVFPGENKVISVSLLNEGNTVLGKAFVKIKGDGIKLIDCFEKQLPLEPSKIAQLKVQVLTTTSIESSIVIQYNTSEDDYFARIIEIPVNVFVAHGLKTESWQAIEKKNEIQISCILHNPSYNAFVVTMETINKTHHHNKIVTIFSEAQSRHKLVASIEKKDEINEGAIEEIINKGVVIKWEESGGRSGVLLFKGNLSSMKF